MCVTLVGGMDRLHPDYMNAAREAGHDLKCIPGNEKNFFAKIGNPDAVIIFTGKISHEARRKAMLFVRQKKFLSRFCIPAVCPHCGTGLRSATLDTPYINDDFIESKFQFIIFLLCLSMYLKIQIAGILK